jgi:hypothetical protein
VDSLPLHALLLVVALVVAIAAQGAYYGGGQRTVAVVLLLALLAALRARPWSSDDALLPPVSAGAALATWAVVSATVAGDIAAALPMIALLTGVVVVLLAVRRLTWGQRDALAAAVVTVGALTAASGWVGVAWRITPWALEDQGLWRAATTLTYANAAAGLLVPLALLAVARLAARPGVPAIVAACLLLIGAGATLSRGGALALVVGAAVLAWLPGQRWPQPRWWLAWAWPLAPFTCAADSWPWAWPRPSWPAAPSWSWAAARPTQQRASPTPG